MAKKTEESQVVLDAVPHYQSNDESPNQIKPLGISVVTTVVFLVGEMAGCGLLALPDAIVKSGWIGLVLILMCCLAAGYNGINLGHCWNILLERYPEYREHTRDPYPAIAEKAVGKWMKYIVSFSVDFTLFGGSAVFLLIASQNVQSLLDGVHVHISFCYWLCIMTACLLPVTWFGTPKDFWPIAVGAFGATAIAATLMVITILLDLPKQTHVVHTDPGFNSFFFAFGTLLFAFGGASTFPTIQHDMKEPHKFSKAVLWAFFIMLCMYLPVSASGYFVYGDSVQSNIIQSMPNGALRVAIEILITCHLLLAIVILLNPIAQEFEDVLKIPNRFNWKRCVLRTLLMAALLFVAESVPHFGAILSLVGGSTVTFLTFVAPSLFYLCLCSKEGNWPKRNVALHHKVLSLEILVIGVFGGVASTYSAIHALVGSATFVPPCYVNITAAGG